VKLSTSGSQKPSAGARRYPFDRLSVSGHVFPQV
jgi:hypothetical protein